jgi:AcrR family transcriptional regulator
MPDDNLTDAAERLLGAAMRLFSQKGYERTSVGEIQEAAGLTFGSGALYKHFPSKKAVLTAGVERFVNSARNERRMLAALDAEPASDALSTIAQAAMTSFSRDSDVLRIVWRDLDAFPELQEKVRSERIRATFDGFAGWLEHQADEGRLRAHDSQAVAAIALGSLVFFRLLTALMYDTPGGIDEERFINTWTEIFVDALASG